MKPKGSTLVTTPSPVYDSSLNALVAQLDRVLASEAKGRGFESRQAHHYFHHDKKEANATIIGGSIAWVFGFFRRVWLSETGDF
jgi:hypothetical protein